MLKKKYTPYLFLIACFLFTIGLSAQNLPNEYYISADGHRLIVGGQEATGFYDEAMVHTVELNFDQSDYWDQMLSNYQSGTDILATMTLNGETLESPVGVRFKGATSFFVNNSEKKSFNITIDYEDEDQNVPGGYETLNLNGAFLDPTFIREVLYNHVGRQYNPSLKSNYSHLYINGEDWGLYPNIQQLDGDYTTEWFMSNDGSRWRAIDPDFTPGGGGGGGGGGGPNFGTGTATLNYLGTDQIEYEEAYTLKNTSKDNPWTDLMKVTDVLENTPLNELEDSINLYMDLDRTLWFLAHEIIFSDDDGYVFKGGMDYFVYWEAETGRLVPLEYDGNTVMQLQNDDWSLFFRANNDDFPLCFRLFQVESIRQRYLAHVRTILENYFNPSVMNELIDNYAAFVDQMVQDDPKKIYTYNQFLNGVEELKEFVENRYNFLSSNAEVNVDYLTIDDVSWWVNNVQWGDPIPGDNIQVTATVEGPIAIEAVNLFYATGIVGHFEKAPMFDDGLHGDGLANDGLYGTDLPDFGNGTYIRFYVEAVADGSTATRTYHPRGAEHEVYFFRVGITAYADSEVVINEIMASNEMTAADADDEYDDWIELYNNGNTTIDLSAWYLSDSDSQLDKFQFPEGAQIEAGAYLIVWTDGDVFQEGLHTSFKLSADGEALYLLNAEQEIVDEIAFGAQTTDMGYARIPNGTGDFIVKDPTHGWNNELMVSTNDLAGNDVFNIFPNPANDRLHINIGKGSEGISVFNIMGQEIYQEAVNFETEFSIAGWPSGVYIIKKGQESKRLVIAR
jgi:hypothetical protein